MERDSLDRVQLEHGRECFAYRTQISIMNIRFKFRGLLCPHASPYTLQTTLENAWYTLTFLLILCVSFSDSSTKMNMRSLN